MLSNLRVVAFLIHVEYFTPQIEITFPRHLQSIILSPVNFHKKRKPSPSFNCFAHQIYVTICLVSQKEKTALLFECESLAALFHHFEKSYANVNRMKKRKK